MNLTDEDRSQIDAWNRKYNSMTEEQWYEGHRRKRETVLLRLANRFERLATKWHSSADAVDDGQPTTS